MCIIMTGDSRPFRVLFQTKSDVAGSVPGLSAGYSKLLTVIYLNGIDITTTLVLLHFISLVSVPKS